MALIIEDGTGRADAEAYGSVAEADAYHAARGNTTWVDLDTDVKEQALRRATDYMLQTYRGRWKGVPINATMALDWPRYSVYLDPTYLGALPSDEVPTDVKKACFELADRATTADLLEDVSPQQVLSESVGALSVTYANTGQRTIRYAAVDRGLSRLLLDGGSFIQGTARLA